MHRWMVAGTSGTDATPQPGNNESITLSAPASGWYHLTLQSKVGQGFDDVTLYAELSVPAPTP